MSGSRPARAMPTRRIWWWLGGAAVAGLAITVVAVSSGIGAPAPSPTPSASQTVSAAGPSVSASPSPSITATPSATPTPAVTSSAKPSATVTRAVQKEAYCRAFAEIKTGSVSTESEDGGVDFDELADQLASLIKSYSRAAKAAPSSLDRQYAAVLGYLKDMRAAVVSRDLDGIKLMITNLELLNKAMAAIQTESEKICR